MMVYNGSAGSDQRWIVVFTRMPGGENGVWHTRSVTQTESSCEVTDIGAVGPLEVILPTLAVLKRCRYKKRDAVHVLGRVGVRSLAAH